jgi:hypothetical protein
MNAIENLAVFAPLVLVAAIIEVSTKATVLSAQIYVAARLAHYVIYTAGIPVVRTLAFLIGACATLVIAIALLHSGTWTAIPDRDLPLAKFERTSRGRPYPATIGDEVIE